MRCCLARLCTDCASRWAWLGLPCVVVLRVELVLLLLQTNAP